MTAAIVLWNTVYWNAPPGVGRGRQAGGRRAAAIPVAAGLGAHQPNRRLRLAAEPQTGRREVSALTDARKTLAYDFFRILRAPLIESSTTHLRLSVTYDDLTLESNRHFGVFDLDDSRVKSRVESPVNRVVSRPATCHNVIAGRRRTRFLIVLKIGFPAAPATLHGHAINCVPVHRFRIGRTPETGLPWLNGVNFRAMHLRAYSCMP